MSSQEGFERVAQKQRTRKALLAAVRELLAEGRHPTLAEAADRAQISRATVYRYFSSPDAMSQEAVLYAISKQFEGLQFEALQFGDGPTDADLAMRAETVVAAILRLVMANEGLFRTYLSVAVGGGGRPPAERGARRVGWISEALAPLAGSLSLARFELLVTGLSLLSGIEGLIVLRDVRGVEPAAVEATARQIARVLVAGVLAHA